MTSIPEGLMYSQTDEWVRNESDGSFVIGITDYAVHCLCQGEDLQGFEEVLKPGERFSEGDELCNFESPKAVATLYAPADGEIIEINTALQDDPTLINREPYGAGWMVRIKIYNPDELKDLMNAEQYSKKIEQKEKT